MIESCWLWWGSCLSSDDRGVKIANPDEVWMWTWVSFNHVKCFWVRPFSLIPKWKCVFQLTERRISMKESQWWHYLGRKHTFKGDVTRDDSQRRFLAQHSVAMLENETIRNNLATMLRRCVALKIVVANRLMQHHPKGALSWGHCGWVLGQFCADVMTKYLYPRRKCSSRVMSKIIQTNFIREHAR